ncbi:MAG: anthranilate phosphoribosyltransferase [Candidatus Altiarchaeum hamiconexum]|uniref:Anthranilate phosphoribosyltransferase n=1 Tax=Candidatus Altarchaeum hamiconexum TaxID=1803513 RepID=A0A8J8CEJ8_9ARCH|nr:anthranilate phosphoribosyltransferase [Candidatus Altarchaeum hamiconexum]OIQ06024.1 MAG: anthranilate phosphoribosyltransferase [Candidatus Altarchaeum sp. CG2_30_32_3053]PIN67292.1 MAG: anthranilate phosphoribosyltransferase [Candidatus Altarchaeum sp. CG12_big_fil_rev_8_21_14_0_65_33_22]PIX48746.1 MAG: anthranilate phosphoribosyltransferase [Candidatus Altarchaeum sp. CG_4_8_14_3_um_filter_33_2054]NCN68580.1 anthranilate phosphoribosyltransferase [Candidatus Altarchaeum hamiconexum]
MKSIIQKLVDRQNLSDEEAGQAMNLIMKGEATQSQIAAFLIGMRMKGETAGEIAAQAKIMRNFAEKVNVNGFAIDTCGTGGDKFNTFNISTCAMFVVAGAGIKVAKHGNRAITSKSGSADVMEVLGVKIDIEPKKVEDCINKTGTGFMFAPLFHKSMRNVMPVRKEIGVRTVFNMLGPLTNPANTKGQVLGVFDENLNEKFCKVLKILDLERAIVASSNGMDEISQIFRTKISELRDGEIKTYYIEPDRYFEKATIEDIKGGDASFNADIIKRILSNDKSKEILHKRNIVILNAAAGIIVGKKAENFDKAIEIAKESIESGNAMKKLEELIKWTNEI